MRNKILAALFAASVLGSGIAAAVPVIASAASAVPAVTAAAAATTPPPAPQPDMHYE